jgi:hypothetical protein
VTDTQKLEFLLSVLQREANIKHCYDECGDYSPSYGNYDDTFEDGQKYGHVEFARSVLEQVKLYESTYNKLNEPYTAT